MVVLLPSPDPRLSAEIFAPSSTVNVFVLMVSAPTLLVAPGSAETKMPLELLSMFPSGKMPLSKIASVALTVNDPPLPPFRAEVET